MTHTILTLASRIHAALTASGLDPDDVDLTLHLTGGWVAVGVTAGERDYTREEAADLIKAIGGVPDGPPGIGFLHCRTADNVGFTVAHAKAVA